VNVAVRVTVVPVPVTVIVYVPTGVVADVWMVSVEDWPEVTDPGLKVAVAPAGRPEAENTTVCGEPEEGAVLTVEVTAPPCCVLPDAGDSDMEKPGCCGPFTTNSRLLGEPVPGLVMRLVVEPLTSALRTVAFDAPGLA
jgi:hypothetical protein